MDLLRDLSQTKNVIQLIYPYTMSQEGLMIVRKGYEDLIKNYNPTDAAPFVLLAAVVHKNPNLCVPRRPYSYRPNTIQDRWVPRPLAGAQVQFTILVPAETYSYVLSNEDAGRMHMDMVLADFQSGELVSPQAVQVPLAKVRVDPFTPTGKWF